jgi:hypothetical protein
MAPVYTREDAKRFYYQLVLRIFKVCGTGCFFERPRFFLNRFSLSLRYGVYYYSVGPPFPANA